MDWTFDLATNTLNPADAQGIGIPLKWRSREAMRLQFLRASAAELLPADSGIALHLIASDGTIFASVTSWTAPEAATGFYTGDLILHTDALTDAFDDEAVKQVPASIEMHWWREGEAATPFISDNLLSALLQRPVVLPESGSPIVLEGAEAWLTARAVRFDEEQTLDTAQKAQALENLGVTGIKALAIVRGCLAITLSDDTETHIPLTDGIPPAL
jgi:hypothetical protein